MCQPLSNALETFLQSIGIDKRDLFYYWPKDSRAMLEDAVYDLFQNTFHPTLVAALEKTNDNDLLNVMKKILLWGGIIRQDPDNPNAYKNDLSKETYGAFISILRELYDCWNEHNLFDGGRLVVGGSRNIDTVGTIAYDCPICEKTPLSSWTKILAAFDMRRFWIYDSRVAIALSFLYANEYNWYIPLANNAEASDLKDCINNRRGNAGNIEESYRLYLDLLKGMDHGTPERRSSYEKKLFMLGGILTDYFTMTRKINNENNFSSLVNHFFAGIKTP